ncbi:MAG: P1 family peptidase [Actinomycetota bacterium]
METRRARDLGIEIGRFSPGPLNAITDVPGVRVGHSTVIRGSGPGAVRTGVTAVWPRERPWRDRVFAGTAVLNGYGELIGISHIDELGLLPTPVVLTSSLSIGLAYDATAKWIHETDPGLDEVPMPVVTECDDGFLNDSHSFPLASEDVFRALENSHDGEVEEGCVGAGTGMQCFDFKGGIGTASRILPSDAGGYVVGALVLTNFGSRPDLLIAGVPVGREITDLMPSAHSEGSAIAIAATNAPMLPHQLNRLALRAGFGLVRSGSIAENWSGELLLAFSTAQTVPLEVKAPRTSVEALPDGVGNMQSKVYNALFGAAVESVEEAVANALLLSETMEGRDGNVLHALPVERTLEILRRHGRAGAPS